MKNTTHILNEIWKKYPQVISNQNIEVTALK